MKNKESTVVIAGRPNVGKSCLFNKIVGKRKSIVESTSGVTRDRISVQVTWEGKYFKIIDTGGVHFQSEDVITSAVLDQTKKAIEQAQVILFVVDSQSGLTAYDEELASFLRTFNCQVIVVVNKVDNYEKVGDYSEFYSLGFEKVIFISALHSINIDELLDETVALLGAGEKQEDDSTLKIAIVGRPNVGKSLFLNKILNEERVIVNDSPGTTRDTVDTFITINGKTITLIDTAGIRKVRKTHMSIDVYSRTRTVDAIRRSDVCIALIDAETGILNDDLHIFSIIQEERKSCVLAVNKSDLVSELTTEDCIKFIEHKAPFMKSAYTILCSAKKGKNLYNALKLAQQAVDNCKRIVDQKDLNEILNNVTKSGHKKIYQGALKMHYLRQLKSNMPTFVLIVNKPTLVKKSVLKHFENIIRRQHDFQGAPIVLKVKEKEKLRKHEKIAKKAKLLKREIKEND